MKKTILYLLLGNMILFIASCQKNNVKPFGYTEEVTASFLGSSDNSQCQERPFKGRIVGSFVSIPTSDPAIYNSIANASGNVTHLGVFSKVTSDVINLVLKTVEGRFIMTSPGGEQLTGNYNGTFSFGDIPGTFSWILNATITGGTGRFSHAAGDFVFLANGKYTIADGNIIGEYTETFEGTIIY